MRLVGLVLCTSPRPPICLWPLTRGLPLQLRDDYLRGGSHGSSQRPAPLEEDGEPPGRCACVALGSGQGLRPVASQRRSPQRPVLPSLLRGGLVSTALLRDPVPKLQLSSHLGLQDTCCLCSFGTARGPSCSPPAAGSVTRNLRSQEPYCSVGPAIRACPHL